jgi:hypothetical protein
LRGSSHGSHVALPGRAHRRVRAAVVEQATQLFYATGVGVTLTLIATPPAERDPELAATALNSLLRATMTDAEPAAQVPNVALRAVALREAIPAASGRVPEVTARAPPKCRYVGRCFHEPCSSRANQVTGMRMTAASRPFRTKLSSMLTVNLHDGLSANPLNMVPGLPARFSFPQGCQHETRVVNPFLQPTHGLT